MPNTNSSSAHVTLAAADLEGVCGGNPAFPVTEAASAFGQGLEATVKNRENIGGAINSFNQSGYNPVYNGIKGVQDYFSRGRVGEGSWQPAVATANQDGSINSPKWVPNK